MRKEQWAAQMAASRRFGDVGFRYRVLPTPFRTPYLTRSARAGSPGCIMYWRQSSSAAWTTELAGGAPRKMPRFSRRFPLGRAFPFGNGPKSRAKVKHSSGSRPRPRILLRICSGLCPWPDSSWGRLLPRNPGFSRVSRDTAAPGVPCHASASWPGEVGLLTQARLLAHAVPRDVIDPFCSLGPASIARCGGRCGSPIGNI